MDYQTCFCVQYVVLVEVGKENPVSYRHLVGKVRCILTAFPGHGRYSLILHQNSTSGNFLMISCHVESETVSMNLLAHFHMNTHSFILPVGGIFYLCMTDADLPNAHNS